VQAETTSQRAEAQSVVGLSEPRSDAPETLSVRYLRREGRRKSPAAIRAAHRQPLHHVRWRTITLLIVAGL
jgi:hypothetical protein